MGLARELEKVLESKGEAERNFSDILSRIKGGESTGDKVKDYCLLFYKMPYVPEIGENLRALEQGLKENQGQQVYVLARTETVIPRKPVNIFEEEGLVKQYEALFLGLIDGDLDFDRKTGDVLIPTKRHVRRSSDSGERYWELVEEPIKIPKNMVEYVGEDMPKRPMGYKVNSANEIFFKPLKSVKVVFGDEAVESVFRIPPYILEPPGLIYASPLTLWPFVKGIFPSDFLGSVCWREAGDHVELSRKIYDGEISEQCAEDLEKFRGVDGRYITALELLGQPVPHKFLSDYREGRRKRYIEIINKLEEHRKEEGAEDTVRSYLRGALLLGMNKLREPLEFDRGIVNDVGKYIESLCKQYGVGFSGEVTSSG